MTISNFDAHTNAKRFQLLVESVSDYAIYMLDPEGRIVTWNAGARRFKGYEADEIMGQHFSRFFTPEDRAALLPEKILRTAATEGRYENEGRRLRKDGTEIWVHVVVDPIWDRGELMGFAKITRDITAKRRRAQEELEEAQVALFQSQKLQALGELTGGIAHDFNNLITIIRGSAELLKNPNLSRDRHALYVDAILGTADRATTLTSRLLAFARRQSLKPEVLNLAVRLDAFGEVLSRTLGSKIKVVIDVAPDVHTIEADATEFENALLNAAFNARDAMPDGGTLTLETRNVDAEDMVCVSVIDTGQGIPPELVERVFEPFFTTKPEGKGTGLGLSQIHGFAAQTGGRATIHSELGKGTTVSLLFPRSRSQTVESTAEYELSEQLDNLRILLVEDNDGVRNFGKSLLEDLGANVTEAATADEAEAALGIGNYDLIFSDVVMPGRSGIELARTLRSSRPDQRVLLATGYSKDVLSGDAAGFTIIQKPYGAQSLSSAIRRCLDATPSSP